MTMIREKTENLVKSVKEFKLKIAKEHGDSILEMDADEFAMMRSMLKFIDDALDIATEQARVIEDTDKKLDDLNSKIDILLKRTGENQVLRKES